MSRRVIFEASAFADFNEWLRLDKKTHRKIIELIKIIDRTPFTGIGKPEPLRYDLAGYWSRRINQEHRLVYQVTETDIIIISCRYHYES
ncbi:Txe/YoeB family addiction module toxin [Spirulina major CS-329]|uniref:Txe/YoeB family addiction module toxin n=1 Tax=Spirulina TaxID=1154 RepID=UPI00232B7DBE|nr:MULTISPECIES: Txe/YoeB family addiction module toxin [Spirulina]MDB9496902.1 Txe/YoeB family addiction module toxin [Spirulina subsalsa CS-330]MDB9502136.1 Txe/YoeB family addiction module toxin [Spirulina major CS-329]